MIAVGSLYDPQVGVLGTIPRLLILALAIFVMGAILFGIVVGVVAVAEWWEGRRSRRASGKQSAPRRDRLPDDPYVVRGILGGTYEVWNTETDEIVATAGWAADAARIRTEYATRFYREQREARDAVR